MSDSKKQKKEKENNMSVSLTNPYDGAVCEVLEVWGPFKYWVEYALNDGSGDFSKCGVH